MVEALNSSLPPAFSSYAPPPTNHQTLRRYTFLLQQEKPVSLYLLQSGPARRQSESPSARLPAAICSANGDIRVIAEAFRLIGGAISPLILSTARIQLRLHSGMPFWRALSVCLLSVDDAGDGTE